MFPWTQLVHWLIVSPKNFQHLILEDEYRHQGDLFRNHVQNYKSAPMSEKLKMVKIHEMKLHIVGFFFIKLQLSTAMDKELLTARDRGQSSGWGNG